MKLMYIAGRYRGRTQEAVDANIEAAKHAGLLIAEKGWFPVIPHLNTRGFEHILDKTDDFFLEGTLELMKKCDAVTMIPGWTGSEGAKNEYHIALDLGMDVYQCPDCVTEEPGNGRS